MSRMSLHDDIKYKSPQQLIATSHEGQKANGGQINQADTSSDIDPEYSDLARSLHSYLLLLSKKGQLSKQFSFYIALIEAGSLSAAKDQCDEIRWCGI